MLERFLENIFRKEEGTKESHEHRVLRGKPLKFLELSVEEKGRLQKRIAEHDGRIRIFIHPEYAAYAKNAKDMGNADAVEKLQRMDQAFRRILQSDSDLTPPTFIFHPLDDIGFKEQKSYEEYVRARNNSEYYKEEEMPYKAFRDVYVLPTEAVNPRPLINGAKTVGEGWGKFREMLKELGVEKILIAGAELYVPYKKVLARRGVSPETDIMNHLAGCLGISIRELRKDFEVDVSMMTYPEGREEIKAAR